MVKKYTKDLAENLANLEVIGETYKSISRLTNYIDSLPYLRKLFTLPT